MIVFQNKQEFYKKLLSTKEANYIFKHQEIKNNFFNKLHKNKYQNLQQRRKLKVHHRNKRVNDERNGFSERKLIK